MFNLSRTAFLGVAAIALGATHCALTDTAADPAPAQASSGSDLGGVAPSGSDLGAPLCDPNFGCSGPDGGPFIGTSGTASGPSIGGPDQPGADFAACAASPQPPAPVIGGVDGGGFVGPPGRISPPARQPAFGATVTAAASPPPISGGTMIALRNGHTAVMADPDRDAVYVVDTGNADLLFTVSLNPGDEPGRLVEDGLGRVHVALRSGGALVTLDPTSGVIIARRNVCPAPRGVAWDSSTDLVWVACATGELVALPSGGGSATKSFVLERDLRDVIVQGGAVSVTEFRSAQVLRVATDGSITRRDPIGGGVNQGPFGFAPHVVWRAVEGPSQGMVMVHQGQSTMNIPTHAPGGYGIGPGVVDSHCAVMGPGGNVTDFSLAQTVLPVDVAVSPDGSYAAVVGAGDGFALALPELTYVALGPVPAFNGGVADASVPVTVSLPPGLMPSLEAGSPVGGPLVAEQPVSVAFDGSGHVLVQMREPAELRILGAPGSSATAQREIFKPIGGVVVSLSSISRADTGHDIFHAAAGATVACASCHPEGGDDGHVWRLDGMPRRTPSLRGTIAGTAPYHWPGDEVDLATLTADVYTGRMGGTKLLPDQTTALSTWVQSIPAPPAPSWVDPTSAQRGQAVFEGPSAGCGVCHSGPKRTNNLTMSVGTCGSFQVPPLVGVGWRTPLMHNGCATTVGERFTKCATSGHGNLATLSAQDVSDLGAFLESL